MFPGINWTEVASVSLYSADISTDLEMTFWNVVESLLTLTWKERLEYDPSLCDSLIISFVSRDRQRCMRRLGGMVAMLFHLMSRLLQRDIGLGMWLCWMR